MKWINQKETSRSIGIASEDLALDYLLKQGLNLIERNFSSKYGEIDLIMSDGSCLTFIEVKYRKSAQYGSSLAMVSSSKQKKIMKTAQIYLQKQRLNEYNTECRFDVIALEGQHQKPTITWLKNAFYGV